MEDNLNAIGHIWMASPGDIFRPQKEKEENDLNSPTSSPDCFGDVRLLTIIREFVSPSHINTPEGIDGLQSTSLIDG